VSASTAVGEPGRLRVRRFVLVVAAAVLAIGGVQLRLYFNGHALRLPGEQPPLFDLLFSAAVACFAFGVFFVGLYRFARSLVKRDQRAGVHLCSVGVLAMTGFLSLQADAFVRGINARLSPVDEPAYLRFAEQVRATFGDGHVDLKYLGVVYDDLVSESPFAEERARAQSLVKLLPQSAFAEWPREMLRVSIQRDSVSVLRGSGRLGDIGVRIFDETSEVVMTPIEDIRANPYLHEEHRISPRVILLTGGF